MAAKRSHGGCAVGGEGRGSISSCSDGGSLSSSSDDEDRYIPHSCKGKQDPKKRRRLALTKPAKDYSLSASRGESGDEEDEGVLDDPPDKAASGGKAILGSMDTGSNTYSEQYIVKPDFDTSYGLHDLLTLNGTLDTMIDMPLFHEVDSLMNIKHEDHLNDTVFYLPAYPLDSMKIELADNIQVTQESSKPKSDTSVSPIIIKPKTKVKNNEKVLVSKSVKNSTEILASSCKKASGQQCTTSALEHMLVTDTNAAICTVVTEPQLRGRIQDSCEKGVTSSSSDAGSEEECQTVRRLRGRAHSHPGCSNDHHVQDNKSPGSTGDSPIGSPDSSGSSRKTDEDQTTESSEDCQEIDRFVICSDITMECVLCSFCTDSYSAFKSHIICSHPCWRITKKLSKNRLLVEKSVKSGSSSSNGNINTKLVQALTISSPNNVVSTAPSHPTTPLKTTAGNRAPKDKKEEGKKRHERNPRKKQLLERNKRLFKCTLCLRLFVFEGSVVNHVTDYHFQSSPYDFIHISNNHGLSFGPIYRCQQATCYFSCESEEELERHQLERHTQVIYRCQLCGYTADSAAAVHTHGLHMHQQQLMCSDASSST